MRDEETDYSDPLALPDCCPSFGQWQIGQRSFYHSSGGGGTAVVTKIAAVQGAPFTPPTPLCVEFGGSGGGMD